MAVCHLDHACATGISRYASHGNPYNTPRALWKKGLDAGPLVCRCEARTMSLKSSEVAGATSSLSK